jgi:hypothetical protein
MLKLYVDDILIVGKNISRIARLKIDLSKKIKKYLGGAHR